MGLMGWLLKGIGFEDEEGAESENIKLERKLQKQKIKEAKKKEREAKKLERTNARLAKIEAKESPRATLQESYSAQSHFSNNLDQYNMSSQQPSSEENYGGYGSEYNTVGGTVGGYGSKNVVFFYPKGYDEVQKLIDYLKQGESVMLNLDNISDAEAQRMLDFASGAIYAINGSIQRVSGNIFLLTPEGLNIMVPKQ